MIIRLLKKVNQRRLCFICGQRRLGGSMCDVMNPRKASFLITFSQKTTRIYLVYFWKFHFKLQLFQPQHNLFRRRLPAPLGVPWLTSCHVMACVPRNNLSFIPNFHFRKLGRLIWLYSVSNLVKCLTKITLLLRIEAGRFYNTLLNLIDSGATRYHLP